MLTCLNNVCYTPANTRKAHLRALHCIGLLTGLANCTGMHGSYSAIGMYRYGCSEHAAYMQYDMIGSPSITYSRLFAMTASCRQVQLLLDTCLRSAPLAISKATISGLPSKAATCSGVRFAIDDCSPRFACASRST